MVDPFVIMQAKYRKELVESYLPYELEKLQENINEHGYVHGRKVSKRDLGMDTIHGY